MFKLVRGSFSRVLWGDGIMNGKGVGLRGKEAVVVVEMS